MWRSWPAASCWSRYDRSKYQLLPAAEERQLTFNQLFKITVFLLIERATLTDCPRNIGSLVASLAPNGTLNMTCVFPFSFLVRLKSCYLMCLNKAYKSKRRWGYPHHMSDFAGSVALIFWLDGYACASGFCGSSSSRFPAPSLVCGSKAF